MLDMSCSYNFRHRAVVIVRVGRAGMQPGWCLSAQDERDGFHVGLQAGVTFPSLVESARRYVS